MPYIVVKPHTGSNPSNSQNCRMNTFWVNSILSQYHWREYEVVSQPREIVLQSRWFTLRILRYGTQVHLFFRVGKHCIDETSKRPGSVFEILGKKVHCVSIGRM